jgi:subfamily B ATP-binding cassette protein MsbA
MLLKPKSKQILKKRRQDLFELIKGFWPRLFLAMACSMVTAGASAMSAYLVKPALDDIFFKNDTRMLILIPIAVVIIFFLKGAGYYGQRYFINYVGQSVIQRLRDKLYVHVQSLSLAFFHQEKTGVLMSRITNDVNIIKGMVSSAVTGVLKDCFTIVGLTFVIFYRDWKLALISMVVLPVAFYPVVKFGRRVRKVSTGCQACMADISAFLHETLSGNKIVKAFGMEPYEVGRFQKKTQNMFRLEMKSVIAKSLSHPVMEFLGGIGIAATIWYGGYMVISGKSTPGTFFSFLAAVLMLYDPIKKLSHANNSVQEGLASADRVFEILETESDIKEAPDAVILATQPHEVVFKDVSFRYDRQLVLNNINLEVKAGEILALVGMSGGGKTSLVNLIPRFYDVSEGAILIDRVDIREISLASLRAQIALVTQEPILFNDSIRNNIAYGKMNASAEEIEHAAKAAYAYDFIQSLPDKFDTSIGELGSRLSGGEKQRICIARALLKDAPILILDEATSSLDAESETVVQKALENLMRGRTTFVIAHRLSTIGYAHRVIVVANGKIVEQGQQADLIARKGEYYKLYRMQFNNDEA